MSFNDKPSTFTLARFVDGFFALLVRLVRVDFLAVLRAAPDFFLNCLTPNTKYAFESKN